MMIPKFRAWHKKLNEFVRVDKHCMIDQHGQISCSDDLILLQFTGLRDKNGVEIFERDFVAADGIMDFRWYIQRAFGGTYIAVRGKTTELLKYINEGVVIIGNSYENPELLEQKNG